jgi:hypothetical protein
MTGPTGRHCKNRMVDVRSQARVVDYLFSHLLFSHLVAANWVTVADEMLPAGGIPRHIIG